jgi:hypothetical protein
MSTSAPHKTRAGFFPTIPLSSASASSSSPAHQSSLKSTPRGCDELARELLESPAKTPRSSLTASPRSHASSPRRSSTSSRTNTVQTRIGKPQLEQDTGGTSHSHERPQSSPPTVIPTGTEHTT